MKADSEGLEILPDDGASHSQSVNISSHGTDAGLHYNSRDPLELRAHATGTTQQGQLVYVLPTNYYM